MENDFEILIPLPPLPKCRDYRPSLLMSRVLHVQPNASGMLSELSTN